MSTIEERVLLSREFYARKNSRVLFGFSAKTEFPLHRYEAAKQLPEGRALTPDDFPVDGYVEDCERLFQIHEACGGDSIWSASAFWGIPWMEAMLGCPIYANHAGGSLYSEAPPSFGGAKDIPVFSKNDPWVMKARELIEAIAKKSAGRYPIGTTRMRGISDLLSAVYGGEQFVFKMMDAPEEVHAVCERLTDLWIEFGKMQLAHIPPFHGGVGSFYYNIWAPANTIWHQEDAAALLSPELFNEFIRPYDERMVKAFNGCIMHEHPTGYMPYEAYMKMGMTALELHIDDGGPSAKKLRPVHEAILAKMPLIIWGHIGDEDMRTLLELPPQGLAIIQWVNDADEAQKMRERYVRV
ncbi:MAG: hypothetical protein AABZ39_14110 [Spirochaetota bacterium]